MCLQICPKNGMPKFRFVLCQHERDYNITSNNKLKRGRGMTKHKLKKDRYVHTRGGNSHLLDIHCSGCKAYLLLYQKDGHGSLLRLYLDRIFAPPELQMLQFRYQNKKDMPNLACAACKTLIGTPMVYE